MKPGVISAKNLNRLTRSLRKQINAGYTEDMVPKTMLVPATYPKLNYRRYKGKGRPRKSDYDRIDTLRAFRTGEEVSI